MKLSSALVLLMLLITILTGGCKKETDPIQPVSPLTPVSSGTSASPSTPIAKSADNSIMSFVFASLSPGVTATITGAALSAVVLDNTSLTSLVPTINLPAGANIAPASGVAQNFTNPVSYTVTAENGQKQTYTITVKHNYQAVIDTKYSALGWSVAPDNGGHAQLTQSGTGWVQYYGSKSQAIYYVEGMAHGMLGNELKKYDAIGQDKFAVLTTDALTTGGGTYYNGFRRVADGSAGVVVTTPTIGTFLVYGDIYKKYLALNRWEGVLGYPTTDEITNTTGFRYNNFFRTGVTGVIVAGPTGSQAVWGKAYKLWGDTKYDSGWLGNPTSSCDPNKGDDGQQVTFQKGSVVVTNTGCGQYYLPNNTRVPVDGKANTSNIVLFICY